MTSMRTLNRRLLRWRRYIRRTGADNALPPGMVRAWNAQQSARERGSHREYGYPGGWWDEPDDYRCCLAGDQAHPGPCVTQCSDCYGDGRCPDCGGEDDLGCGECGGSGACPGCWGEGELVEDWPPTIVTIDTGGLL